jgi:alkylresorcinol/alkylpyrone synthase
MPLILSASHASPPNAIRQEFLKTAVAQLYSGRIPDLDIERIRGVFDHSRIRERAFMMPMDWYISPRTPQEKNRVYMDKGLELLVRASRGCLEASGCRPDQVDHVIFATSTGLSTPSLDSHLINKLGLPPNATRLPMWGLGCSAGAAGIARAFDYCLAHPRGIVLLAALETCSLNFMPDDLSKLNLVAMSLFADGCAAVLVAGDEAAVGTAAGPTITAARSHLFPGTTGIMGWDVTDRGFRLILTPQLPEMIRTELGGLVDAFLLSRDLTRGDIAFYITHPGGAKILDAIKEALALSNGDLRLSEEVLRDFGNVSSVSVLLVLERWMSNGWRSEPGYGLLSAFGPGYSVELVLLHA